MFSESSKNLWMSVAQRHHPCLVRADIIDEQHQSTPWSFDGTTEEEDLPSYATKLRSQAAETNLPLSPGFRRSKCCTEFNFSVHFANIGILGGLQVQHAVLNVSCHSNSLCYLDPKITPLSGGGNLKTDWLYYWHYSNHKRAGSKIDVAINAVYSRCQIFRQPLSVVRVISVITGFCREAHTMTKGVEHP